jgi:hypothetical protein
MTKQTPSLDRVSAARPARCRSAVTNGRRLHVVPPGDTAWARRFADVLGQIIADLGGPDGLSEGQRQLARRASTISIACEQMEGQAAAGEEMSFEVYGRLTDRLGRIFDRLGIKRQARDMTPTLDELLAADDERERPAAQQERQDGD